MLQIDTVFKMGDSLEFGDILQENRGAMNPGRLKLQANAVIFKNMKTGRVDQFPSSEIEKVQWLVRARGYCLKLVTKNGVHRFDGFKEMEYERLSDFIQNVYDTPLQKRDLSVKGWNWGTAKFVENSIDFDVGGHTAFDIPLGNVSHATTTKNEVTLEFHQNDDASVSLMEMRFHIPTDANAENDAVQEFYSNVLSKADIIQATGDAIANFTEVQCLTPRGRYDIKIYPSFLQLHGKTFDYKIPYTTILRLFLLPHRDGRQMFFVVSLDPPIKQGQTRYHFMILLFNKEDELTLELGLPEEDIEAKYEGKLTKEMSGPEYEIISRIMKTLVNRKITVPGTFIGHSGTHSIACSYKAATGFLYPLERGFIFVHKPPLHIRFDEVSSVNFARSAGSTRSFDFDVTAKSGTTFTFVGIEKDEYGKLYDFVIQKKLRVKNIGGPLDKKQVPNYDDMLESEDEGGDHDAYLHKVKQEGKEREVVDDEDEDSSDDEDFDPGSGTSEPDDEYDSNISTTTDSDEGSSDDASGSGGGEGSEDEKPKKKDKPKKEKPRKEKAERKPRKTKSKKDPNQPKRPQSAYFLWLNQHREQIKEEHPGISITELTKKAGEMWRDLKDKSEWEAKAAKEKQKYEEAMKVWRETAGDRSPPETKQRKSPKKKVKSPTKESRAGAGESYKSKEFISDSDSGKSAGSDSEDDKPFSPKSDSDDDDDDDDKPLKPKMEEKKKRKDDKGSSSEEEKPTRKRSKRQAGQKIEKTESEEDADLPDDEDIEDTPPSSGKESDAGDSDSD